MSIEGGGDKVIFSSLVSKLIFQQAEATSVCFEAPGSQTLEIRVWGVRRSHCNSGPGRGTITGRALLIFSLHHIYLSAWDVLLNCSPAAVANLWWHLALPPASPPSYAIKGEAALIWMALRRAVPSSTPQIYYWV